MIEGVPQPFESIKNHSRKELINRSLTSLTDDQWRKHVNGLQTLSILAGQASEFEVKKNRTEGKTGIVKPDLIPTKSLDGLDTAELSPPPTGPIELIEKAPSPKREKMLDLSPQTSVRKISPKTSPRGSPLRLILENEQPVPTAEIKVPSPVEVTKETKEPQSTETTPTGDAPKLKSSKQNGTARPPLKRNKGSLVVSKPPNILVYSESNATRNTVIATLKTIVDRDM